MDAQILLLYDSEKSRKINTNRNNLKLQVLK